MKLQCVKVLLKDEKSIETLTKKLDSLLEILGKKTKRQLKCKYTHPCRLRRY